MIKIDEGRIFQVIEERKPRSVALNGAEALIPRLQDVADHVHERFGIEAYVIGDPCWGSCDLNTHAADMLGADILFNIGHTVAIAIDLRLDQARPQLGLLALVLFLGELVAEQRRLEH